MHCEVTLAISFKPRQVGFSKAGVHHHISQYVHRVRGKFAKYIHAYKAGVHAHAGCNLTAHTGNRFCEGLGRLGVCALTQHIEAQVG